MSQPQQHRDFEAGANADYDQFAAPLLSPQRRVYEAVVRRGWRDGYSAEGFFSRQLLKLIEEAAEFGEWLRWGVPGIHWGALKDLGNIARMNFKSGNVGRLIDAEGHESDIEHEMADELVTLFCKAAAWEEMTGRKFDIEKAAVAKAEADVKRGING